MKMSDAERDKFIVNNMDLIHHYLNTTYHMQKDDDDAFQLCCEGLIKAVDTYDETLGYTFATYACKIFRNVMCRYLSKEVKPRNEGSICTLTTELAETIVGDDDVIFDDNDSYESNLKSFYTYLSSIEAQVLYFRLKGLNQVEIAKELSCTKQRVSIHIQRIREKYIKWKNDNPYS